MSAKNIDYRGRWRNQTVAFRVTPEEKKPSTPAKALAGAVVGLNEKKEVSE